MSLRIIKIGGSLLDWPALPRALRSWLAEQPAAWNVLVCGGGSFADLVRNADGIFGLGDEAAHWLAIDSLSVTARLLATILNVPLATTQHDLAAQARQEVAGSVVFDAREFLHACEPHLPGQKLPYGWNVTSDSIAARLAETLAAGELVLLKSDDPPAASLADLATAGYIDLFFPTAAKNVRQVKFVNLRPYGRVAGPASRV
jgi:aspartokinase-like uncharacterized kinase